MNRTIRGLAVLLALALGSLVLTACEPTPTYTIVKTADFDPGYDLRFQWAAYIPVEPGYPTVCDDVLDPNGVASWQCRSLHGYDEAGGEHRKNYIVHEFSEGSILAINGSATSNYGKTMVMWDGRIFEGCVITYGKAVCDYYSTRLSAPFSWDKSSTNVMLRKTWDWFEYAGDAAGCAFGISNVIGGGALWKEVWLTACVKGPM